MMPLWDGMPFFALVEPTVSGYQLTCLQMHRAAFQMLLFWSVASFLGIARLRDAFHQTIACAEKTGATHQRLGGRPVTRLT